MIFSPVLNKNSNIALYIQLYEYIKSEITVGLLKPDSKLPSIREASSTLKLSKTTIENAYSQLVAEGYIDNIPKKGYYVCNLIEYSFTGDSNFYKGDTNQFTELRYINDGVDNTSFDISAWKRIYTKVISDNGTNIYNNGSIQGEIELRNGIADFVNTMRGGNTTANQVIIGAGIQYLLGILMGIIKSNYTAVAVETPGYSKAEFIFEDYSLDIKHIPVTENGFPISSLKDSCANLVYISPSHQYPMGTVMPINKRMELLDWAYKNNGLIIEDDYDGIIRYGGMPIPCLQGLDKNDCVIYLGSFSKMLLPSLRISYMIIPKNLLSKYYIIKSRYTQSTSKIDQLVLANFMKEGYMLKHLRKIKRIYRKKNLLLTNSIIEKFKDNIEIKNSDSGLHIVCEVKTDKRESKIIEDSKQNNILLNIVSSKENKITFSLNYSGINIHEISEFTDVLGKILFSIV
nr:PLP-dependent aminotransferase family protein [Sedimentibacter sp.]